MLNSPRIEQVISQRERKCIRVLLVSLILSSISTSELNPWNLGGSAKCWVEREGLWEMNYLVVQNY
jgi:hypothetical protein